MQFRIGALRRLSLYLTILTYPIGRRVKIIKSKKISVDLKVNLKQELTRITLVRNI